MTSDEKFSFGLLGFGALAGLFMALLTLVSIGDRGPRDPSVVAMVNGVPITRTNLDQRMNLFMRTPNFTLPSDFETRILEALIDEELLVQESAARGLMQADAFTRQSLDMSVSRNIFIQTSRASVTDTDINTYYQANKERLTPPFAIQVDRIFISKFDNASGAYEVDPSSEAPTSSNAQALRLDEVRQAIQSGESFSSVKQRLSDPFDPEIPRNLLRTDQLSQYLKPELIGAVERMREGAISDALQTSDGWSFLHIVRKQAGTPPALSEVSERIRKILEKEAVAKSRKQYLSYLRKSATIETNLGTDGQDEDLTADKSEPDDTPQSDAPSASETTLDEPDAQ
jgi:parvulin-like peptidyl-prolyl isomerase